MKKLYLLLAVLSLLSITLNISDIRFKLIKCRLPDDEQWTIIENLSNKFKLNMSYDFDAAETETSIIKYNLLHKLSHYTINDVDAGLTGLCTTYTQAFVDILQSDYNIKCKRIDKEHHSYVYIEMSSGSYELDITSYCNSNKGMYCFVR